MHDSPLDGLITVFAGLAATLLAFGVVPASKDEAKQRAWRGSRIAAVLRFTAPVVTVWAVYQLLRR